MYYEDELLLVEEVKRNDDSEALAKLVEKYHPMIDNLASEYFITSFDRDDWYQEAFITCFDACKIFDGSTGSKFGSFFKMKFKHHVIDLIRYENATKRKVNGMTESLDEVDQSTMVSLSQKNMIEFVEQVRKAAGKMNHSELVALRFTFGNLNLDEACKQAKCSDKSLRSAASKCKKKIQKANEKDLS